MKNLGWSCNGIRGLYFLLSNVRRFSTNIGNTCTSPTSLSNFLVDSLGFSNALSLSTSAKLSRTRQACGAKQVSDFDLVDKAKSVVHFLNQLGFQQSDLRKIVSCEPRILVCRVDKTLKPKIKLLKEVGISGSDLPLVVRSNPSLLHRCLSPTIRAFRTVLGSDENVVRILKRSHRINFCGADRFLIPNVELLKTYCNIPIDSVRKHILRQPWIYTLKTDLFRALLARVEHKLGIPRDHVMFLYGMYLLSGFSEKNIDDKCAVFKSFGCTQSDVMELIKRNPLCLTSAEARIKKQLDFLINQLGFYPTYLASNVQLLTCSVEKRLLPRHRILQALKEKGLLKKNYHLGSAAVLTESLFLKRFVLPFEEVHQVYAQLTGSTLGSLKVGSAKSRS